MNIQEIIGIDVSKSVIDLCVHSTQLVKQFENSTKGFNKMVKWLEKTDSFSEQNTLFVFEHTGLYSQQLTKFLDGKNLSFKIVSGLEIKQSLGVVRGKSDPVDAQRIALYGYRLKDEITPSQPISNHIAKLKSMASLRTKLVKQRSGYKACLTEQKSVLKIKENQELFDIQKSLINTFSKKIDKLEKAMMQIIKANDQLKQAFDLITSIKGVGKVTAIFMLITTENFTKFPTWRKFACYCGIAPFPYQSGSSISKRTRVSNLANKQLKSLLNMCALTAIKHNPEMKIFYNNRIEQKKNKMSTLNIIRNKLVARIFAVVKRGTPYVDTLKYAC